MTANPDLTPDPGLCALLSHSAGLRALARGLLGGDEHAAEDVVQETWVAALERRQSREAPPGGWLAAVARHLALKRRREEGRRSARERAAARGEPLGAADAELAQREVLRKVVEAVLALDERYEEVVRMRYFQDLPPREIARRLGEPVATIDHRLHRARRQLRERLDATAGGERRHWAPALAAATGWRVPPSPGGSTMTWPMAVAVATVAAATVVVALWPGTGEGGAVGSGRSGEGQGGVQLAVVEPRGESQDDAPQRTPVAAQVAEPGSAATAPDQPFVYRLEGRVVDDDDLGVPAADIWLVPVGHPLEARTSSDSAGRFALAWRGTAPRMEVLLWADAQFQGLTPAAAWRLELAAGTTAVRAVLVPDLSAPGPRPPRPLQAWWSEPPERFERALSFRWPPAGGEPGEFVAQMGGEVEEQVAGVQLSAGLGSASALPAPVRLEAPTLRVEGVVYRADGAPAAGAPVALARLAGPPRRVTTTDRTGHYAFDIGPGTWTVIAGGGPFGLARTTLAHDPDTDAREEPRPRAWSPVLDRGQEVHGSVTLADGADPDGWVVALVRDVREPVVTGDGQWVVVAGSGRALSEDATVVRDGRFALPNVAGGGRLLLTPPGRELPAHVVEEVTPSAEPLVVVVPEGRRATGRLAVAVSAPEPGSSLEAWVVQAATDRATWLRHEGGGTYAADLPSGVYRLVLGTTAHGFVDLGTADVAAGETAELAATLPAPGRVTWEPAALAPEGDASAWTLWRLEPAVASFVAQGRVAEPPAGTLAAGRYSLWVAGREHRFAVRAGGTTTLEAGAR